jgi:hypothetical protein
MDQYWAVLYVALVDVALTARTAPAASTLRALRRYREAVSIGDHTRRPSGLSRRRCGRWTAGLRPPPYARSWPPLSQGLSNREIADRLRISPRTVAVHVSRLLAKTGSASRTELAVRHLRGGGARVAS